MPLVFEKPRTRFRHFVEFDTTAKYSDRDLEPREFRKFKMSRLGILETFDFISLRSPAVDGKLVYRWYWRWPIPLSGSVVSACLCVRPRISFRQSAKKPVAASIFVRRLAVRLRGCALRESGYLTNIKGRSLVCLIGVCLE